MIQFAARAQSVIQYDGSNSAEIVSEIEAAAVYSGTQVTVTGESGGVLALHLNMTTYMPPTEYDTAVNVGDWVSLNDGYIEVIAGAEFSLRYIVKS